MAINSLHTDDLMLKVLGMHRTEFEKAKQKERYTWISEFIVAVMALASIFINTAIVVYGAAIIALIAAACKWMFSFQSNRHKDVAERARRILLLVEGLGYKISSKELTDLIASFSVTEIESAKWEDAEYFKETSKTGYKKFARMLQESAFFSKCLYQESAKLGWWWFISVFSISLLTLFLLPSITNQIWSIAVAQIISIALMFLVSVDLLGRAVAYSEASRAAGYVDDRLEGIGISDFDENDLIFIWGDYNAAVQNAPLIPTSIYQTHKERLDRLFTQRTNTQE